MKKFISLCVVALVSVSWMASEAQALAPFKKAFQQKYVDDSDSDTLKAAFKKASCNTCHIKGKKKDMRNPYGMELAKLIEGDAKQRIKDAGENGKDAKKAETDAILEELEKAFEEVADKSASDEETFGDRIKAGKLPLEM